MTGWRPAFDVGDERIAAAAWSRLTEPGDRPAGALVGALGPVAALDWLGSGADGAPPGFPAHPGWGRVAAGWRTRLDGLDPRRELSVLERLRGTLLVRGRPGWPAAVDDLGDGAPPCLWVLGDPALLGRAGLALVGARASTRYGERVAEGLAAGAGGAGLVIVSGGAFGIDAAAHRAALATQARTTALLACGVDRAYPAAHRDLLAAIAESGAVVSEVPPGSAPLRHRFLQRNRLIAALSRATVVVEAAWRSGALNTAHQAAELLRPVGAVPGPVTSMASAGCHRLIREGVAVCVTDAAEALELCSAAAAPGESAAERAAAGPRDGLDETAAAVLDALPARGPATVDSLTRVAGRETRAVMAALGRLELLGLTARDGARWRRVARSRAASVIERDRDGRGAGTG